jgi:glycosyltransferase involved in cell wall biosynthesis
MKILQVIPYFTPKRGGPVNGTYALSKELAHKGNDVTIITTDFEFDKNYAASLETVGVKIVPVKCVANIGLFLYSPAMKSWLEANLKNFDVIHMRDFRSYQNVVVERIAKRLKIPYIVQAHGSLPRIIEKQNLKKLYDWVWGYRILKNASKAIALTNSEVTQYKQMGVKDENIVIIPNGLDVEIFENLPKYGQFREKHGITTKLMVLYLGRIHKIKGIDLLIKSFSSFAKETSDAILVIAGPDAGYLPTLQKLAKKLNLEKKVLFVGPLYGRDKLEAYVDADVYVLPSIYEVFGLTLLEACACNTPVITTDRCGLADIINGQVGLVVPYNENALCRALSLILGDETMRQNFGKKGKLLVQEQFNLEKISKQLENLYQSISH